MNTICWSVLVCWTFKRLLILQWPLWKSKYSKKERKKDNKKRIERIQYYCFASSFLFCIIAITIFFCVGCFRLCYIHITDLFIRLLAFLRCLANFMTIPVAVIKHHHFMEFAIAKCFFFCYQHFGNGVCMCHWSGRLITFIIIFVVFFFFFFFFHILCFHAWHFYHLAKRFAFICVCSNNRKKFAPNTFYRDA